MENSKETGYLVVKSNELIQHAVYRLTATEQKFLCFVISKIKPTDTDLTDITVSAADFAELAGIDKRNIYTEFKEMANNLDQKRRWLTLDTGETILFRVFSEIGYNDHNGSLTVRLHSKLKKYLLQIHSNYTEYELWNILSLKSKYAIRLYELFKSYAYQKHTEFEVETLKGLLCCEGYTNFYNLKKRVLDPAIEEINELTNLNVSYTTKKKGKGGKVSDIYFDITQKKSMEAYKAYRKTADRINEKAGNVPGQLSIFDMKKEDFVKQ